MTTPTKVNGTTPTTPTPPPAHLRNPVGGKPTPTPPTPARVVSLPAPIAQPRPGAAAPKPIEKPKPRVVGKMETIEIDASILQAALMCAATQETRYYLKGVYIHRTADGFVRAVSTDGSRCLIANLYRESKDKPGAKWLDHGLILPADGLAQRLKLIEKEHKDAELMRGVRIAWGENQPRVEIADALGINLFKVQPIDGTFPDYEKVTTASWSGVGVERADWKPTGFNPSYLKAVGDIAKRLGTDSVQCFDYVGINGTDQPVLFTFGKVANVSLFLMPAKADPKMAEATRLMLAPAIKLTLAALRAHETRNRDAAKDLKGAEKDAALAKADAFAKRIKDVVDNAGSGSMPAALPAPKPPKVTKPKAAVKKAAVKRK